MRISDWSSDVCSSDLDVGEDPPLAAHARLDAVISLPPPAAVPAVLVFPVLRIADPRLALDVVEPGVLDPLARGPHLLAGHRAGMAADAFVEVQNLTDLGPDLHSAASPCSTISRFSDSGRSRQSTSLTLRMMTNSSTEEARGRNNDGSKVK